jgi:prepilin-type N-terminal cleavage/methylation domain-containing protein
MRLNATKHQRNDAFTLVELMICLAMLLILLVAIGQVFRITSRTVGTGQALGAAARESRAAQAIFADDLRMAASDSPCIVLQSTRVSAYRDRKDELSDRDGNILTIDVNENNVEGIGVDASTPGENIAPANYNFRNHRTDRFSYFARGLLRRQTANFGAFTSSISSSEGWIWYGHAMLPHSASSTVLTQYPTAGANYFPPGIGTAATNAHNFYASDWILARVAMLLSTVTTSEKKILRTSASPPDLSPLAAGSTATADSNETPNPSLLQYSRYDLAETSIDTFRADLLTRLAANAADTWWTNLDYRFNCNPFVRKPLTSQVSAYASPYFVGGCTQFIVEFAGDFVTQEQNGGTDLDGDGSVTPGKVIANTSDGTVDFYVASNGTQQIRWYGMPRDTNGDGKIPGWVSGRTNNQMPDVVPLRDVFRTCAGQSSSNGATFERNIASSLPPVSDYAAVSGGMTASGSYTCAWDPGDTRPKMIRITLVLDDARGRLPRAQSFEYIFDLP